MFSDKDLKDGLIIAKKYTKSIQDAEEVLQDACVKAFLKREQCRSDFGPWFRTIVRTTALNCHRYDRPTVQYTEWIDVNTVFENVMGDQRCLNIKDFSHILTKNEYGAIVAKHIDREPRAKFAKRHGVVPKTVTNWYNSGIKKLRKKTKVLDMSSDK